MGAHMLTRYKAIAAGFSDLWKGFPRMCRNQSTIRTDPHPVTCCPYLGALPMQQDDVSEDFYMEIVNRSLKSAYKKYGPIDKDSSKIQKNVSTGQKTVAIVGAGASGLAAAFELEKVGFKTRIFELQHRVGGRMKTLREGFSTGLHAEGGAMRIPPNHYLTNGYLEKFAIPLRPFINYNEKAWLYLDGQPQGKITNKEWKDNNKHYSDLFFPGWDQNIHPEVQPVDGILDLYSKTVQPVKDELTKFIDIYGQQKGWEEWVNKWSKLSVDDFLRSQLGEMNPKYRPWPEVAIRGFQIGTYSPEFGSSLVEHLRDEIGEWWQDELHTPVDGMDSLAKNFIKPQSVYGGRQNLIDLAKRIRFGTKVQSIKKTNDNWVNIAGYNLISREQVNFTADAAIVTVPLTILRQMDIDISEEHRRAMADINYGASTKIVLQCKSRFWETTIGTGGFTKTDLPIGQLHYPSPNDLKPPNGRGLLVCYTWGQDALIFGSQPDTEAIENAVREVSKIHPEMKDEFEVGMVQAWFSDPTSQGAYANLLPYQYNDGMKTLMTPDRPIYLSGEAISYTNGWIQGALESGLNAAYRLYSDSLPRK